MQDNTPHANLDATEVEKARTQSKDNAARDAAIQQARNDAMREVITADLMRNGGPVNMQKLDFPDGRFTILPGANLLDYFAGKAMAGILTSDDCITQNAAEVIAETAYRCAAAMLKEREKYNKKKGKPDA